MIFIIDHGGKTAWIGDGFCDDMNNNQNCNYDDGDCCGAKVKKNFCVECKCKCKFKTKINLKLSKCCIQSHNLDNRITDTPQLFQSS